MADKQDEGLKLLREIKSINHMIDQLEMQINEVYTILTSTTVKPKEMNVQTSSDPDPMATKMCKILELQEKLQEYQTELCAKKLLALEIIKCMKLENQNIITLRYFNGYTVEKIGEEVGYTYRWIWEKLHEAEQEFISIYENNT